MTDEMLLKLWQAIGLVAEVEKECRGRKAVLSLARDAEAMLTLTLVAAAAASAATLTC